MTPVSSRLLLVCASLALAGCPIGCNTSAAAHEQESATAGRARRPRLVLDHDAGHEVSSIDLIGLSPEELRRLSLLDARQRGEVLQLYVASAASEVPPLLGTWEIADRGPRFISRFPLAHDLRLRLIVKRGRLAGDPQAADLVLEAKTPAAVPQPPTELVAVYPTADQVPANLLKFYIHFSRPMSRGDAYRHIHLVDARGQELKAVFLELGQELWDPNLQRFTLFCDPARIKRGLLPREELGPVLEAGQRYKLVIDRDWRDANGQSLVEGLTKSFQVLPPDEEPIDARDWKIEAPRAGSRDPLIVRFHEALDHSLLERVLRVVDSRQNRLPGAAAAIDQEKAWQFTPDIPWTAGEYQLVADSVLEDLAGNSLQRAFDVDVLEPGQKRVDAATATLPFSVR